MNQPTYPARFPRAAAVLRRISHARFCSCFLCASDLCAAEEEREQVRADSEDQSESDADIDFVRAMGAAL